MPDAVDEKSRRAVYAAAYAAHEIATHLVAVLGRLKSVPQGGFGKPELLGDQENRRDAQPALVLNEHVTHIPEQSCRSGELGGFRSDLGVRMHFSQREMTKNESPASAEGQLDLIDDRICQPAMRAFIVAVFDKSEVVRQFQQIKWTTCLGLAREW